MSLRLSSSNSPNDDLRLGSVSVQWAWLGDAPVWLPFANKLLGRELFCSCGPRLVSLLSFINTINTQATPDLLVCARHAVHPVYHQ